MSFNEIEILKIRKKLDEAQRNKYKMKNIINVEDVINIILSIESITKQLVKDVDYTNILYYYNSLNISKDNSKSGTYIYGTVTKEGYINIDNICIGRSFSKTKNVIKIDFNDVIFKDEIKREQFEKKHNVKDYIIEY